MVCYFKPVEDCKLTRAVSRVFGSSTIAAGVFLCLDLLTCPKAKTELEIHEGRNSVEVCISSLQKDSHRTAICREGSKTLRRLLELESAQEERPISQADLTQLIKSMAGPSQHVPSQPLADEQDQSLWPALMAEQSSAGTFSDEDPCLSTFASSSLLGTANDLNQQDAYWLMDSIVFPGI